MQSVLIVIHLLVVIALIAVVLLQRSEGGALGDGRGRRLHDRAGAGERAVARHRDPRRALFRHRAADVGDRRLDPRAAVDPRHGPAPSSSTAAAPGKAAPAPAPTGNILDQLKGEAPAAPAAPATDAPK